MPDPAGAKIDLRYLAARHRLKLCGTYELVGIGILALDRGYDSHSLRLLAGESKENILLVEQLFENSMIELGVDIPTQEEAIALVSRQIAHDVIDGSIPPREGAKRMRTEICMQNEAAYSRFLPYIGLESEYEDYPEGSDAHDKRMVEECLKLVRNCK